MLARYIGCSDSWLLEGGRDPRGSLTVGKCYEVIREFANKVMVDACHGIFFPSACFIQANRTEALAFLGDRDMKEEEDRDEGPNLAEQPENWSIVK